MSRRGGKNRRREFNPHFERDYDFYFNNRARFNFSGSDTKKDYSIQLPGEPELIDKDDDGNDVVVPFAIPYSIKGKNAKECFYRLDSEGKRLPCAEPDLLIELLCCKGAVNLQIKIWAQSRAEYTLPLCELKEYAEHFKCPDWVVVAVEMQKAKILKEWAIEKKYKHSFYKDAMAFHLYETIVEQKDKIVEPIKPDKIIIINKSIPDTQPMVAYSPFGRANGFEKISATEAEYLHGDPAPLIIRVPVEIEDTQPMPITNQTVTLYRPIGNMEHHLIRQTGNKRFPPRKEEQLIFYPVLTEAYAIKIARDWNTKDPKYGKIGFVTRFKVKKSFIDEYDVHSVGGREHQEYWIPSEDVSKFNDNIVGEIETIHIFRG